MENTVQLRNENNLKLKFDLKGSTYGRNTQGNNLKPNTELKDLNYLRMCASGKNFLFLEEF